MNRPKEKERKRGKHKQGIHDPSSVFDTCRRSQLRSTARRRNLVVQQAGQEVGVVLARNLTGKVPSRKLELVTLRTLRGKAVSLLLQQTQGVALIHATALRGGDAVTRPLPQLATRNLGGGSVFHEEVDRNTANAAEPTLHVAQADVQVLADTVLGDLAGDVGVQQVVGGDVDILAAHEELVRGGHVLVEDLGGYGSQGGVCHPGAIVAGADLTQLVGAHALHGLVVGGGVILDGDLSSHTTLM